MSEDRELAEPAKAYLLRRGYTPEHIRAEGIFSLRPGLHFREETNSSFNNECGVVVFTCKSASGETSGLHTCTWEKKEYRYFQTKGKPYLPILYGAESDFQTLFTSKEMILTEGVFDRIAIKRCLPTHAVFARLSKGTSGQLTHLIQRYADRLILAFDQDGAGKVGTEKAEKRIGTGVQVNVLNLPSKDPAFLLETKGLKFMEKMVQSRMEMIF